MNAAAAQTDDGLDVIDGTALLDALLGRPEWHARAACRGTEPARFFPSRGKNTTAPVRAVLRTCRSCPVRVQCLRFALDLGYPVPGVWGGTLERQRRRARRRGLTAEQLLAEIDG
jgi:WhiB family transcriptional regulator, redox-sensing transcriptional regulator